MGPNDPLPYLGTFAFLLFGGGVAAGVWAAWSQHPGALGAAIVLGVAGLALLALAHGRRPRKEKERSDH